MFKKLVYVLPSACKLAMPMGMAVVSRHPARTEGPRSAFKVEVGVGRRRPCLLLPLEEPRLDARGLPCSGPCPPARAAPRVYLPAGSYA